MNALQEAAKNLAPLTPGEVGDRRTHPKSAGNKTAFLRAARGTMSVEEAACLRKLIDDSCERFDE